MSDKKLKLESKSFNIPTPVTTTTELPADPQLQKIAGDVLTELKYSFAAAAANAKMLARGRADTMFQNFLAARNTTKRAAYQRKAQEVLRAPVAAREMMLGRFGKIDLGQYAQVGSDGVSKLLGNLQLDGQKLKDTLTKAKDNDAKFIKLPSNFFEKVKLSGKAKPKLNLKGWKEAFDIAEGAKFKKLGLFIKEVHCIEETDEFNSSDEINIGGTKIEPNGDTHMIDQFVVSDDFDEGEKVGFGGGRLFAEWNLVDGGNDFPKPYPLIMAMAEKDDGGFYKFLKELWNLIDEKVTAAIAGAIGAAIGALIGNVIGAIVGFIVGAFIGWLISLFDNQDDILGVKPLTLWLGAATRSYYEAVGLLKNPPNLFNIDFTGDGGHYRVWCYFRASA